MTLKHVVASPGAIVESLCLTEPMSTLCCCVQSVTEGLQSAYRRLRKHISDDSGLFLPLWDRLTALLFQKFSRWASTFSKTQETNGHVPRLWICKAIGKLRSRFNVFMAEPLVVSHRHRYSVVLCGQV